MDKSADSKNDAMIEEWARSFLLGTSEMVFLKDRQLVYIAASEPFARIVGRNSAQELIGKTDFDLFNDSALAQHYVDDDRRMIESGKPLEPYIEPLPKRNGKPAWCRTRKDFIRNAEGEIIGVYGISEDITEKKELEQDNRRLSEVVIDSDIFAFECDPITDTLYNVRYASIIEGLPLVMPDFPESFIKLYIHPDSANEYRRLYADMKKGLPTSEGKVRYLFAGKERLMYVRMRNSLNAAGESVRVYGTARDLSLLTELERQYHITLEQHNIYSWVIDVQNHTFSSSDFIRHEYGSDSGTAQADAHRFSRDWGVHPSDCAVFFNAYHRLLAGEQRIRERMRRRNEETGKWDWMSVCLDGIYDNDGIISRIYVSAVNINKQVENEERYAEFQSYQRMALKNVIFSIRLNLTRNTCFSSTGKNEGDMTEERFHTVDEFWDYFNHFVANPQKRREMSEKLNRTALLSAYARGVTVQDFDMEYDFNGSGKRWTRSVVEMMENPYTHDIEALAYFIDIDQQHMLIQIVDRMVGMDYELLGVIALDTKKVQFYKQSTLENDMMIPQTLDYPTGCLEFFKKIISPEELNRVVRANSIETVKEELDKQAMYSTSAKVNVSGKSVIKKWTYAYLDERKTNIVYTRTDVTDIIESRQREREELEQALSQAKLANSAKTEFLSRMSHDIRTPMNAIINLTELAFDDVSDTERLRGDLEKIKLSGNFLLGLINDILDMSRIESGRVVLTPTIYPLERFLNYLDSVIMPVFTAKNISFTIRPSNLLPAIYVDEVRFNQIFFNILSNAAKYTPEGGVVTYDVNVLSHDDRMMRAEFIIRDNGIGMSREFLKKAFSPFERETAVRAYTGTGLGLPITKALVEALGGTIRLESEQGKGTTVTITLTLPFLSKEALAAKEIVTDSSPIKNLSPTFAHGRVLVAEDHPLNREVITRLLQKRGFETVCAENGLEAVNAIKNAQRDEYQVILMDVRMPVMDGITATKEIRAIPDKTKSAIPIIAMTADAFIEDRERCLSAGMDEYLSKPVDPQKLYTALLLCLNKNRETNPLLLGEKNDE